MKMLLTVLALAVSINAHAAFQPAQVAPSDANLIGAEVIARSVLAQNLLGKQQLTFGIYVRNFLEGSNGSGEYTSLEAINCEPELGNKECTLTMRTKSSQGQVINGFDMVVQIYHGKVFSAHIE